MISQQSVGMLWQFLFILGPIIMYVHADVYVYASAYGCCCARFYIKGPYNQPEIVWKALAVSIYSWSDYCVFLFMFLPCAIDFYIKDNYNQSEIFREASTVSIRSRPDYSACLCQCCVYAYACGCFCAQNLNHRPLQSARNRSGGLRGLKSFCAGL